MKKSTIGVIGVGEVGRAITEVFKKKFNVLGKDLEFDDIGVRNLEVLHICIPYSDSFVELVINQVKANKPKLVVIHSTVKPGTTTEIFSRIKIPTAHSPVMGTHDKLAKYILKFTKFVGPVNRKSADLAKKHLEIVGINIKMLKNPQETELGKLLDTTYYAWNIIFGKVVWQMCIDLNINYDSVYKEFNKIYNDGYKKTKANVLRPILDYVEGPIGGHCIIPNIKILDEYFSQPITKFVLKHNEKFVKK